MDRTLRRPLRPFASLLISLAVAVPAFAQEHTAATVPAAARDAYQQGIDAESRQQFDIALERFQFAYKQAGDCLDCLEHMAIVQQAMGDNKAALATASRMTSAAHAPKDKARADMITGRIWYEEYFGYTDGEGAYDKNPGKAQDALRRADTAFAHAVQEDPANEQLMMLHGHLLASLKRDSDASAAFAACAAVPGTSAAECARALRFSKDVDLARDEPAPAFEATTLDGQKVSLASLAGKVVLLDFWGTWCPVCRRDSDYVQSLEDSFSKDRFVLLEVDSGDTQTDWSNYIQRNRLKGVQVQDANKNLGSLFRVSAYPTYVILDGDGVIRRRVRGARGDLRGDIRKLLADTPTKQESASVSTGK